MDRFKYASEGHRLEDLLEGAKPLISSEQEYWRVLERLQLKFSIKALQGI